MAERHGARRRWFDAHLDLAYLAALGRAMEADPAQAGGPDPPATVTLRSLREGAVAACLGTIFVEADGADPRTAYAAGDVAAARRAGMRQLAIYDAWMASGLAHPLRAPADGGPAPTPLRLGILIEGADPIADPDELSWWAARGVVAVAMAWWRPSRYSGGNGSDPAAGRDGLTDLGRGLAREIDRLGLTHDVSHLSDRAFGELLEVSARGHGAVVASHSNCRALLGNPANQRHLTDAQIRLIVERGGVVGLNLYSRFLTPRCDQGGRATVDEALAHVEHVCTLAGSTRHVGLGSDADGGFAGDRLPEGFDRPAAWAALLEGLARRGWSDADLAAFAWGNWARVLKIED